MKRVAVLAILLLPLSTAAFAQFENTFFDWRMSRDEIVEELETRGDSYAEVDGSIILFTHIWSEDDYILFMFDESEVLFAVSYVYRAKFMWDVDLSMLTKRFGPAEINSTSRYEWWEEGFRVELSRSQDYYSATYYRE